MGEPPPKWSELERRLTGAVVLPEAPAYEHVRKAFIARFDDVRPQAVVLCRTPEDVRETIRFARRHRISTVTRSGGHCFAGYSTGWGIVIDVSRMHDVSDLGGCVRVGAGTKIGHLFDRLLEHGATVPSGSCPSVGVGGTTLGGGLGVLGRKYGLTLDHLVGAQAVLADGRIVECDERHHEDLFWALRGAGAGSFGVVTSLLFRTTPAQDMTNFYLVWPFQHAARVTEAWQACMPQAPDEMAAGLGYTSTDRIDEEPFVELYGAMLGGLPETTALLDHVVARAGVDPSSDFRRTMSYRDTQRFQATLVVPQTDVTAVPVEQLQVEQAPGSESFRQGCRFTKSEYFDRLLPPEGVAALVAAFTRDRVAGQYRSLEFAPWGGAYNRVEFHATAFVHRSQLFSLKHAILVAPAAPQEERRAALSWVNASWAAVNRWASGFVYPNFPDPDLADPLRAYYGANLPRLARVKASYDPDDFFSFQQSIPAGRLTAARPPTRPRSAGRPYSP